MKCSIHGLAKATEGLSIAQAILNSTMLANPFVAILAAVVGLVTGLFIFGRLTKGLGMLLKYLEKYTRIYF